MAGLFRNITNSAPNWVGLGLGLSLAISFNNIRNILGLSRAKLSLAGAIGLILALLGNCWTKDGFKKKIIGQTQLNK